MDAVNTASARPARGNNDASARWVRGWNSSDAPDSGKALAIFQPDIPIGEQFSATFMRRTAAAAHLNLASHYPCIFITAATPPIDISGLWRWQHYCTRQDDLSKPVAPAQLG